MYEIYKTINGKIESINAFEKDCWINVVSPSPEEIDLLISKFDIPRDFIVDSLDPDEISRLEFDNENFLVIHKIPVFEEDDDEKPFTAIPVGIIVIFDKLIITVCRQHNKISHKIIKNKIKGMDTAKRDYFLLHFFNGTIFLFIKDIKIIRRISANIEDRLKESMKDEELIKLFNLEKILIKFLAALRSNHLMISKLQRTGLLKMTEEKMDLLEDVLIDNLQAIEMCEIYGKILNEMMDFFSSLFSNSLNSVMKFLTALTIIFAIPTLVASIYGMNVSLPFQNSQYAFYITIGAAVFSVIIGVIIFIKSKIF